MAGQSTEHLQDVLIELERSRLREINLAEENRAILSTISGISKAKNVDQIFSTLDVVLKKYIHFDDFIVISKPVGCETFKTILTNNKIFDNLEWIDHGKFSRVINGECTILFEPKRLKEFEKFNAFILDQINSVLLTGIDSGLSQSVILFIHSNGKHFSVDTKMTLNRFRPLIERAVLDIERKEHLEATIKTRTKELVSAQKEAERANKAKSTFLAMMSHEIRTPLNAVIGLIDTLKTTQLGVDQLSLLTNMGTSSELLLSIINDVLDFSKIESGNFSLTPSWQSIRDTVTFVSMEQERIAQQKGLTLSVEIESSDDIVYFYDKNRLAQILFNLIGNAIKFTEKGSVDVSITCKPELIAIQISDTGIGISDTHQSILFHPFIQADDSITRRFGGTGLGLAITKHLVDLMNGDIKVLSSLNIGSKFLVNLPFKSRILQPSIINAQKDVNCDESDSSYTVLVVEDNLTNQMVIKLILSRLGHKVYVANNGQEAIELVEINNISFDIIFMDVSMPVLDGLSTTKMIRQKNIQTPIIALTAHTAAEDRSSCLDAGMNEFITKPVRTQEIRDVIYKVKH
ncbi:response regulator [Vibrio kagoshimensis]